MNQHQLRKTISFIAQSIGKRLYVPPEQWNLLLPKIDYDLLKNKYGFPKSPIGAETGQQITDSLLPFKKSATIALTLGVGTLPADYFHPLKCKVTEGVAIDIVTELEDWERENNSITKASTDYPTAILYEDEIQVKPTSISSIDMVYIKRPTTPTYLYTMANGIITYDANSVQFEWGEEHDIDIIRQMLEYLGISLTDKDIIPYVMSKKVEEN